MLRGQGGHYDGVRCEQLPCILGACRLENDVCIMRPDFGCDDIAGEYQGDGTDCDPNPCEIVGVGDMPGSSGGAFLHQNVPNPFLPSTEIRYFVPRSAHVELTVLDVTGRRVATLIDGFEGPGLKSVRWDVS